MNGNNFIQAQNVNTNKNNGSRTILPWAIPPGQPPPARQTIAPRTILT